MKQSIYIVAILGVVLATVAGILVYLNSLLSCLGYALFHVSDPPQPKFGYAGDWTSTDASQFEERPLPPAREIWRDYSEWKPNGNHRKRLYLARLGGAESQSGFSVSTNMGDTPIGAKKYTWIDFVYTDPTNGTYNLEWSMRGQHDPSFLRFNNHYRFYHLSLGGQTNEYPPRLFIDAIEGIKPQRYVPLQ